MPYFVATKMSKVRKPSLFIPSPETYVKSALSKVGVSEVTNGYWPHSLQVCIGLIIFNTNVQVLNIRIHVYIPSALAKGFPSTPLLIKLWQISLRKSATGSILWLAAAAFVMRSAKGFMVSRVDLKPLAREDECKHVSSVLMIMEARWCHITKITFWLWYKNFVYT